MKRILASACFLALAACSGDDSSGRAGVYSVRNLVSDGSAPAAHTDSNLKNPWGIAFNPAGPVWVADNGTNRSTLYDGTGSSQLLVVDIPPGINGPAAPTGIVFNNSSAFTVSNGLLSGPAAFIFSGEAGTITGWALTVNPLNAITAYDDGAGGAVYKGLAIATRQSGLFLYATDFHNAKVDVFDGNYNKATVPGGFEDPSLPAGYAPFGIQNVNGDLFVTFAKQNAPENRDEVDGPGLGIVDVFDPDGDLLRRFATAGRLNAPWGIALAPADFGAFSGDLLIGNFGDGMINAYDPETGAFAGRMVLSGGQPIVIPGLWGIAFGPGVMSQPKNTLFFAAGIDDEAGGLYGRIDPPATM